MPQPHITVVDAADAPVWHVGRAPDPWAWTDWRYAGNQRWDDVDGVFRTIYAADSLYACYVEVLAYARPDMDPGDADLLAGITEDTEDAAEYPSPPAGVIPTDWIQGRMVATALLEGPYADVRTPDTIAALRPEFIKLARKLGYPDFDAAALKSASPRELTQRVAHHLYTLTDPSSRPAVDGVRFASRHGDELTMWAVFERDDEPSSHHIKSVTAQLVDVDDPDLIRSMTLHRLTWA